MLYFVTSSSLFTQKFSQNEDQRRINNIKILRKFPFFGTLILPYTYIHISGWNFNTNLVIVCQQQVNLLIVFVKLLMF